MPVLQFAPVALERIDSVDLNDIFLARHAFVLVKRAVINSKPVPWICDGGWSAATP
jgi:hypothetical protein